jgi:exodeoxyribonuclease VII large subunit
MESLIPAASKSQQRALSVSEVTKLVRGLIEGEPTLRGIWVRGETSNVRVTPTGHLFFTLKDEDAQLSCVFFSYSRQRKRELEAGVEVYALGDITVYAQRGQYQLTVRDLLLRGEGELAARFEKLKRRLAEEGLFAEAHKLPLPKMPQVVGLVTSAQAAAFTDVVNVLTRRAPYLRVVLFPAAVQGEEAAPQLIAALKRAEAAKLCEVILLVRGGGSLEDLWCFNDEELARCIYGLNTPVISGIGHEVDFTIADFVADHRAPTPSVAAEVVAPDIRELRADLRQSAEEMVSLARAQLQSRERELALVRVDRLAADALRRIARYEEGVAHGVVDLRKSVRFWLERRAEKLNTAAVMLGPRRVLRDVQDKLAQLDDRADGLVGASRRRLEAYARKLQLARARLAAIDPQATLERGYALLWDGKREQLISRARQAEMGKPVAAELADGFVVGTVDRVEEKPLTRNQLSNKHSWEEGDLVPTETEEEE